MDLSVLPAFVAVILVFLIPPGPDMAYMLAVGLQGGRQPAVRAILGIGTGMSVYAAAVVLGVAGIVQSHPAILDGIRVVGAAYLLWMAWVSLRDAHQLSLGDDQIATGRWYARGLVISLTNPKIVLFFLAVLPQFLGAAERPGLQLAMLGAVNVAMEVVLYGAIGLLASTFHVRFAQSPGGAAVLHRVSGVVYLLLAVAIVLEMVRR